MNNENKDDLDKVLKDGARVVSCKTGSRTVICRAIPDSSKNRPQRLRGYRYS